MALQGLSKIPMVSCLLTPGGKTACEYEKAHGASNLQGFFDSSLPHLRHEEVKRWGNEVQKERRLIKFN